MSSPFICHKHGKQFFAHTSPSLEDAVKNGKLPNDMVICSIKVVNDDNENHWVWYVDDLFLKSFIGKIDNTQITLTDRSIKNKKLNDRLLIRKIRKSMSYTCPKCLDEIIQSNN